MRLTTLFLAAGLFGCATAAPAHDHMTSGHPAVDPAGATKAFDHPPKPGEKAICAVSGDVFVVAADTVSTEYNGKYYAFCCEDCPDRFKADPAKYAQ